MKTNRTPKIEMTCTECGKTMLRYKSTLQPGAKPFCSQACLSEYRRHGSHITCARCGVKIYRRFGEQNRGTTINAFCSRVCYTAHRREHMKITVYPKIGSCHIHRLVAANKEGRPLKPGEVVHHIDNNPHNSAPANLLLFRSQEEHARFHMNTLRQAPIESDPSNDEQKGE